MAPEDKLEITALLCQRFMLAAKRFGSPWDITFSVTKANLAEFVKEHRERVGSNNTGEVSAKMHSARHPTFICAISMTTRESNRARATTGDNALPHYLKAGRASNETEAARSRRRIAKNGEHVSATLRRDCRRGTIVTSVSLRHFHARARDNSVAMRRRCQLTGYAKFFSWSHDTLLRAYDAAGYVI
jgi:hypothetical protein